jgi:hypothetical protein|tara:strand:+ start:542 stop:1045 length:504 start_codon:yes stop_codon:yes gene_type:complete
METIIIISIIIYVIYRYSKRLTPEQKELLQAAEREKVTNQSIIERLLKKEITLDQAIIEQEKIEEKERIAAEEKAKRIAEEKAKRIAEEKALLDKLSSKNRRIYFSYSLVNTESELYLINPTNNTMLESSKTNLNELYKDGWQIKDIDKTGKSAQFDSFNMLVRLEK